MSSGVGGAHGSKHASLWVWALEPSFESEQNWNGLRKRPGNRLGKPQLKGQSPQISGFLGSSFNGPPTCSCSRHFFRAHLASSCFPMSCSHSTHTQSFLGNTCAHQPWPQLRWHRQGWSADTEWEGKQRLRGSGVPESHHSQDFAGS